MVNFINMKTLFLAFFCSITLGVFSQSFLVDNEGNHLRTPTGELLVTPNTTSTTLKNGLVSYWSLDEPSGTLVEDSHGSNDGISGTAVTRGIPAKVGLGTTHGGGVVHIDVPDDNSLDITSTISISAWVRITAVGSYNVILSKRPRGGSITYQLYLGAYQLRFAATNGVENGTYSMSPHAFSWAHVVVTYDIPQSQMIFYVNGSPVETLTRNYPISSTSSYVQIGEGFGNADFLGDIDEVGIWNRVLTPSEILLLNNSMAGLPYDQF